MSRPVLRFAPSPNGRLHLGHAYSALLNEAEARRLGGHWRLRIEDIDPVRSRPEYDAAILEDLGWLGLAPHGAVPRQSGRMAVYAAAAGTLRADGLLFACRCTRGDIARAVADREAAQGAPWPRDPDGAPLYPGTCRSDLFGPGDSDGACAWRLDTAAALARVGRPLRWTRFAAAGPDVAVAADPSRWGCPVLVRKDVPTSYHLAVVVDDAEQAVTHVVRGQDLEAATDLHVLLQACLGLPSPAYQHHRLIHDAEGEKLSKSAASPSLASLREAGIAPVEVRRRLGF